MNATFLCPTCGQITSAALSDSDPSLSCGACGQEFKIPQGAVGDGAVRRCLVCPSTDLFLRKDFHQRLGLSIVVVGIAASCVTWGLGKPIWTYAILFGTALVDLVLYLVMPEVLTCYRCGAVYRGLQGGEHGGFDLETHERYRQHAARLAEQKQQQ